jgi:hypothetical protein
MVAPVVLITAGGLLLNGTLLAWTQTAKRAFNLPDEASEFEASLLDRRLAGLRRVVIVLDGAVGLLILGVIFIALADTAGSLGFGYVALALVLAGTVGEFIAVLLATAQAMQRTTAAQYAARRKETGVSLLRDTNAQAQGLFTVRDPA